VHRATEERKQKKTKTNTSSTTTTLFMPRYAQLVIGPAGSGKSTYCQNVYQHCQSIKRTVHVVNLDPAADHFEYPVSVDIRELISLEDVMEELKLGPNGGLIYCMEYLEENLEDWFSEQMEDYIDDDYLIFDCPGSFASTMLKLQFGLDRNGCL
jgi:GTPase SAR1 family protein